MSIDLTSAASDIGGKLVTSLPAQFLALLILNTAFLGGLLWFLSGVDERRVEMERTVADARVQLLAPILNACGEEIETARHPTPKGGGT